MTKVEVLQECRMAVLEENALSRQIDRLAMMGGPRGIGSQAIEQAGDRRTNNAQAGQIQRLAGLIEMLQRKREEDLVIVEQAETVIERLKDRKDRVLIRLYYVEGNSEYAIAEQVDMSRQWVNQRRNRILDELAKPKKRLHS